jgi:hypothetical protein
MTDLGVHDGYAAQMLCTTIRIGRASMNVGNENTCSVAHPVWNASFPEAATSFSFLFTMDKSCRIHSSGSFHAARRIHVQIGHGLPGPHSSLPTVIMSTLDSAQADRE